MNVWHLVNRIQRATYNHNNILLAWHSNQQLEIYQARPCPSCSVCLLRVCKPLSVWNLHRNIPLHHPLPLLYAYEAFHTADMCSCDGHWTGDDWWDDKSPFGILSAGQRGVILTVNAEMLSCQTQGYDIKVREARNYTTTRNISKVINQSIGKFLAYLKDFDEICI